MVRPPWHEARLAQATLVSSCVPRLGRTNPSEPRTYRLASRTRERLRMSHLQQGSARQCQCPLNARHRFVCEPPPDRLTPRRRVSPGLKDSSHEPKPVPTEMVLET